MKSLMRKLVAGPKKKTPYNGQELDLTYITERIIAMAFPASGFFEKTYRNSIDDVASYFNEYHPHNYMVINVSSRRYNYAPFENRVIEYEWPDHQAPPITTLFDLANRAYQFLIKNVQGVIAVHCNHGKGRTGTAIISILLYIAFRKTAEEALQFYNSRRFSSETYGVDQPCQTRYLGYVQDLLMMSQIPNKLIAYRLAGVSQTGLHDKHFITIKQVRTAQMLVERFNFNSQSKMGGQPLMGDLFLQVFEQSWSGSKHIARINFNTFFIHPVSDISIKSLAKDAIKLIFRGNSIKCSKSLDKNFTITLDFQYFCLCHLQEQMEEECECKAHRDVEEKHWRKMIAQQRESPFHLKEKKEQQKQELLASKQEEEELHEIYALGKNLSNIHNYNKDRDLIGVIKQGKQCQKEEQLQDCELGSPLLQEEQSPKVNRRRNVAFSIKSLEQDLEDESKK